MQIRRDLAAAATGRTALARGVDRAHDGSVGAPADGPGRGWENMSRPASASPTPATGTPARSPIEAAVAWSLAIGGLLVLGRALVELLEGLAELPGANEHWAGDVTLWLVFVLPVPVLAGATMLAAARWVWRHRIGSRGAIAVYVGAVGFAAAWIAIEAGWFLGQGSYWGSLDDPLLWAPVALLTGAAVGAVIFVGLLVQQRRRAGVSG